MPSTLIELMLRSPDSNNLAKASLWEGRKTEADDRQAAQPPPVVPSFVGSGAGVVTTSGSGEGRTCRRRRDHTRRGRGAPVAGVVTTHRGGAAHL